MSPVSTTDPHNAFSLYLFPALKPLFRLANLGFDVALPCFFCQREGAKEERSIADSCENHHNSLILHGLALTALARMLLCLSVLSLTNLRSLFFSDCSSTLPIYFFSFSYPSLLQDKVQVHIILFCV